MNTDNLHPVAISAEEQKWQVAGRVFLSNGLPAEGLPINLYKNGFGNEQLLGEAKTDSDGRYTISFYDTGKKILVSMKAVAHKEKLIPLMTPKYLEKQAETINLVAPAGITTTAPEYNRLLASMAPYVEEKQLGEARESNDNRDLSWLFQQTGWDTRLIALAALANKRSAETGIQADILYGLFRTGLPTDIDHLSRVKEGAIGKALEMANKAGIVQVSAEEGQKIVKEFAATRLRQKTVFGGLGKLDDFLKDMDLPAETTNTLASIFLTEDWEGASIWDKAKEKGVSADAINKLQLQGKISFLTLNNPPLTNKIQHALEKDQELSALAGKGYYNAAAWKNDITELADNNEKKIREMIPADFPGDAKEALDAYANDMARKIKAAYPTESLAAMVAADDIKLGKDHEKIKKGVSQLLMNAASLKVNAGSDNTYVPGSTSFHTFLKENKKQLLNGIDGGSVEQCINEAKKLTRLYQLSPTDESMQILYNLGFTSAFDIAAISHQDWQKYYEPEFATRIESEQIYTVSVNTTSVLYNFYTSGQQVNTTVPTGATGGSPQEVDVVKNNLIKRFPTMESLFGSIDFCECAECRSVLSPAAYLVDILRFLDPDENEWTSAKLLWKRKHNNTDYTGKKPFEVLTARRADIPLILLNCANTNIPIPHIDIANEIFECYVAGRNMALAAYDTGDNTADDLLAEPQNTIPGAYEVLTNEVYPLNLPFEYSLELVRNLSDHFDIPFWKLLHTFRKTNDLFAGGPASPYYLNDIFMEYLGLTAKEYDLFTQPDFGLWYKLYGYASENDALSTAIDADTKQVIGIVSAKTLSRKLGLTYKELVQVLKLHFINPALEDLAILRSLHITTEDVHRWKSAQGYTPFTAEESAVFNARLAAATTATFNATVWLTKFWNDNLFAKTLLLFDTEPGGNFDKTKLQFANGQALTSLEWVKINLFVRLWKKLGCTAEELDTALVNFMPKNTVISTANFGDKCKTALVYLSHLKQLQELYPLGKTGLQTWGSIWGNLAGGSQSVYQRYFLTGSIKNEDPIYVDPLGKYLQYQHAGAFVPFTFNPLLPENRTTGNVGLVNHLPSVQAALGLSTDDIRMILAASNLSVTTVPLNMSVLQLLNGFKVLKEATRLNVADILSLQQLSGIQPLKELPATPLAIITDDYPYTQTLRFLEIAATIKEAPFSISELNLLVRHQFDPEDPNITQETDIVSFIRSLSAEVNRINGEQTPPPDNTGYTDEFMQERLLLALSPGIAGTFLSMWNDTIVLAASENTLPADKLPEPLIADEQRIDVTYDTTRQLQTLTYTGVLNAVRLAAITTKLNALEALPAGDAKRITTAQKTLALSLLNNIMQQSQVFYDEHVLKPVFKNDATYAFAAFFPIVNATDAEAAQLAMKNTKRIALVNATLLFLKNKFGEEAVVNQLASVFNLENGFTKYLLNEPTVAAINAQSLQQVYNTANTEGVSIHFIRNTTTGEIAGPPVISRSAAIQASAIPANTTRVVIAGFLEVQVAGAYRFYIKGSKQAMQMKLSFAHLSKPVIENTLAADNAEVSAFVNLEAGIAYQFSLEIANINNGNTSISIQSEVLPKGELTRLKTIPQELVNTITKAHMLLGKIASLLTAFEFTREEVSYMSGNPTDLYQFAFRDLPTTFLDYKVTASKVVIEKLFTQFLTLVSYAKLKKEIAGGQPDLANLFGSIANNQPSTLNNITATLAVWMRRDQAIIENIVSYFGYDAFSFSRGKALENSWEAVKLVYAMGISTNAVTSVLPVVSKTRPFTEKFDLAIAFKQALKSRYPRDSWNQLARSIFDRLRQQKRDALSAYIKHREKFDSMGQLFEYFLIDPGMEPVVLTSRIRLAISSVQSFVQRCLLNLEPGVSPSLINRSHWDWMKRYRVWEANRKIFLFPENWLEPEFRDNKTPLFEDLEGEILQGDINKDLVERVFYNYLKGLEKIARLNMVAMYCEEDPIDITHNKIHVIAKDYSQPSYYYRTYADREWTPWVPIPDQIEGEHLALIKWQDRLHIFWLTFLPKSESAMTDEENVEDAADRPANSLIKKSVDVQLNWCEYFQGEWQPRQTGGFENAMTLSPVTPAFTIDQVYVHATIETGPSPDNNETIEKAVLVHVSNGSGQGPNMAFRLVSKLAQPVASEDYHLTRTNPPYKFSGSGKTKYKFNGQSFLVGYTLSIVTVDESTNGVNTASGSSLNEVEKPLFTFPGSQDMSFLFPNVPIPVSNNEEINRLVSPFFFEDNENSITLYAEPDVVEKTTVTWEEWIIRETTVATVYEGDDYWVEVELQPFIPYTVYDDFKNIVDPKINPWVNIRKEQLVNPVRDWLTKPETVLQFDESFLGARGRVILEQPGNENGITNVADVALTGKQVAVNGTNVTVLIKEDASIPLGISNGINNPYAGDVTNINLVGAGGLNTSFMQGMF